MPVKELADEAGVDYDEALIALWDAGFENINGPSDRLARGDANRARRALGLATRRERASADYWCRVLGLSYGELASLLTDRGISKPYSGGQLTKKAQHRLHAAAKERGQVTPRQESPQPVSSLSPAPLIWEPVGRERECHGLLADEVIRIHEELVADFHTSRDPISPSGVKSAALLESAVHRPETSSGDTLKYPTVEMGAAALLHALVHNHPFHNGNKRTALVAMIVFIDRNGYLLTADENELFRLVLQLAQHALWSGERSDQPDREVLIVARWLRPRVRRKERGDRAIPWRDLRHILVGFECTCDRASRGQRMTVTRIVERGTSWLGRKRTATLISTFTNVEDGRDVDRNIISKLRTELELDEAHSIDSAAFYQDAALSSSYFIRRYQGILRRLANV